MTEVRLASVLLGVIILWICEPVPVPVGGLGVAAVVILGVAPASAAVAPFGSTTIFTFIGALILAQAMLNTASRNGSLLPCSPSRAWPGPPIA
ncbi:anion permease [Arthrobacter sp. ISL-72]|uniref:anion permease n=1 Tax=Arthrobacter sp. ISL-72 TaxID=2819114 RepID=UPI002035A0E4|nr:anion permease [Arthrobacter sp. ISL-72]